MINLAIQIHNGTAWETLNTAVYPIKINERLDDELDSGNFVFYTKSQDIYPPFTKCKITVGDTVRYFYMNDAAAWYGGGFWQHTATLTEPTKILEGYFVSGLAVTQPREPSASNPAKTLYQVLQRVLAVTPLRVSGESPLFQITTDSDIVALLRGVDSPEYRWGSQTTLWEVLSDIGAYIDAMPRLVPDPTDDSEFNTVTFDLINEVKEVLDAVGYTQAAISINESQYCSALETDAENIVASNAAEASTVFPGQGAWATPRSDDSLELTSDNCKLILPTDIERINKIFANGDDVNIVLVDVNGNNTPARSLTDIGYPELDMTDVVVEYAEWQTLDTRFWSQQSVIYPYAGTNYKDNTWYYHLRENTINLRTEYNGLTGVSVANNVLASAVVRTISNGTINIGETTFYKINYNGVDYGFRGLAGGTAVRAYPLDVRFRVEYNELNTSSKARTVKSESQNADFIQPFNQRAEINNAQAFGRNMKGTVDRMGVPVMEYFERVMNAADVKKVGAAIEQNGEMFIITAVEQEVYAEVIYCTYALSQNWSLVSQYVSIDKKFRNWNIPAEVLQRNLYDFDYAVITDSPVTNTARLASGAYQYFLDIFKCAQPTGYTNINNAWIVRTNTENNDGVVLSAASFALGASLLFSAKTQDNLSAGKNRTPRTTSVTSSYICREVYYCEDDGTLDGAVIEFGAVIDNLETDVFPQSNDAFSARDRQNNMNSDEAYVLLKSYYIQKDPSEQLNFSYQVHFVSPLPSVVVGPQMALTSPLIRQMDGNKTFKVWGLTKRVPQNAVKILSSWGTVVSTATTDDVASNNFYAVLNNGNVTLVVNALGSQYVGWAITDEDGNLYLAQNESPSSAKTLYMGFMHNY